MRARALGALGLVLLLPAAGCSNRTPGKSTLQDDTTRKPEDWLRMKPVRLLYDYIRLQTTDDKGEKPGAEFLQRLFDCAGIETEMVCPVENRCNLLARLPGRSRQGALLLLNHIDVVDAFPNLWKEGTPFDGTIKLGYLYGRGAYDMKSLGLAEALAMLNLKERGVVPASDILFVGEADEEAEQKWGSRWLLEHRPEWFAGVTAILNEGGTNEMILRTVRFWGIETVQAGFGLLQFEASTAAPLKELAGRWSKVPSSPVEPLPDVVRSFDMLANHLSHPLTDPLRHLDRVRRDPEALAKLPDRYGSFLETRIQWFAGYPYPPGAKDNFRGYVVVSTPPGRSPDPYLASIEADAERNHIRIVSRNSSGVTTASPYLTSTGELVPLLSMIQRVTEAFYPGVPFGPVPTAGGGTTSVYFRQKGIATYGYSPVPANITDSVRRHGNDERIFLRDFVDGVELYKELLLEFAFFGDGQKLSPN